MLKRKYQSGNKTPNPKKMNVESGNLSTYDTGNLVYDKGIFVKDDKSGKYLETSKEDVERLIAEGKIDPRNTDQIKYGLNDLKRDNAVTKEDRTNFDRFAVSNKSGFNYNNNGELVDRMGRVVDDEYMSGLSGKEKRQLGKSYKQAEMNEKTGAGKIIHSLFGSKKKALERGLEGTNELYGLASNRLAFQVPNYKKEEPQTTTQPIVETAGIPVINQVTEGEIKTDKAGYKYKSIKSGNQEYIVYQAPGSNEWVMTNKAGGEGDTFNMKGYGQGMDARQKYLQDFYYGKTNQNLVRSGSGSGKTRITATTPQTGLTPEQIKEDQERRSRYEQASNSGNKLFNIQTGEGDYEGAKLATSKLPKKTDDVLRRKAYDNQSNFYKILNSYESFKPSESDLEIAGKTLQKEKQYGISGKNNFSLPTGAINVYDEKFKKEKGGLIRKK